MTNNNEKYYFDGVESVITQPLSFKAKLAIGEDAYTSLRLKNAAFEAWDAISAGAAAVTAAKSATVASTFFAPTGLLSAIGIGTAVTPVGWVIAAGFLTSGAWLGISRYSKKTLSDRATVIPDFINTPMDVLAIGLFKLIAPLVMKIADADGHIDEVERDHINNYFVKEWGYDKTFVTGGLALIESDLSEFSIKELAITLAEFKKANPDCNYGSMSKEIVGLLRNTMEVNGVIDEREEMAIKKVQNIFEEVNATAFSKAMGSIKSGVNSAKNATGNLIPDSVFSKKL